MKHRGDNAPANAFTLEEQPKRPGFVLVRFYENVQPFTETQGDLTISGFEYDEYYLELEYYDGLQDDILSNYDNLLAQAKAAGVSEETEDIEVRVAVLETDKADREEVQAVWDQMAAAYSLGVNEA